MKKKWLISAISVVIIFQIIVLAGEYISAVYPLWRGKEIRMKIVPVDPRSYFRGNYARLRYPISSIPRQNFPGKLLPRQNEIVYVKLQQNETGLQDFAGIAMEKPQDGLFIRGRVYYPHKQQLTQKIEVRYGIEAWFQPKTVAENLEKELQTAGVATIRIAKNGKAVLVDVASN